MTGPATDTEMREFARVLDQVFATDRRAPGPVGAHHRRVGGFAARAPFWLSQLPKRRTGAKRLRRDDRERAVGCVEEFREDKELRRVTRHLDALQSLAGEQSEQLHLRQGQ